jgi:hypothetical protein
LSEAQLADGQVCTFSYDPEFAGLDGARSVSSDNLHRSDDYTRSGRMITARLKPETCRTDECQGIFVVFHMGDQTSFLFVEGDELHGDTTGCFNAREIELSNDLVLQRAQR